MDGSGNATKSTVSQKEIDDEIFFLFCFSFNFFFFGRGVKIKCCFVPFFSLSFFFLVPYTSRTARYGILIFCRYAVI